MISEERLRTAARAVSQAMIDSLPEPEDCHHDFSPEFERKMKKLLRRSRHWGLYQGMKRAACFFLVLLLSGGAFLTVNAEARGIVFGWVSERVEDAQRYFFAGNSTEGAANIHYTLPTVPEGYEEWGSYDEGNGWSTLYCKEDLFLEFGYYMEPPEEVTMSLYFTTDDMERTALSVHDMPAEYYQDHTGEISNLIVWVDSETNTLFYISGYLDKDQLVELAESVVPVEK